MRTVSRSAARLTRHRAFDFGGGRQVGELKNQPKMNPKTIAENVMTDKWAVQKPLKIIKNRVWDHPGGSRGGSGTILAPGRPKAQKGDKTAAKQ